MKFDARVYRINKGKNSQCAYFATIKKEEAVNLCFREGDAVLLKITKTIFLTVIRKLKTSGSRFMLGFTIPFVLSKNIGDLRLELIGKSLSREKVVNDRSIYLLNLIPKMSIHQFPIFLFGYDDNMLIWIYSKGNKFARLPGKINLSSGNYDLLELAGAFFCEGFKSRKEKKHLDRFSFSNADILQIKWFVEACQSLLKIEKNEWKIQILYPKEDTDRIISYWSSFGLLKENLKVVKNITTNDYCGVCILNIYNSSLAESFYYLAEECQRLSLLNQDNAIAFFRGISRGDLGIGKASIKVVSFTTESKINALFFKQLCKVIGINTSEPSFDSRGKKGCWYVYIFGQENFHRLINLGCITHAQRKDNLSKMFFTSRKSRYFDYLIAVSDGYNTNKKLVKKLGIDQSTAGIYLPKFCEQGLLNRKKDGHHYTYKLSDKGKKVVNFGKANNKHSLF